MDVVKLIEAGERLGLVGEGLQAFVNDEQDKEKVKANEEREDRRLSRELEKAKL